eukprot:c17362_g1_i1 orf=310-1155(+)
MGHDTLAGMSPAHRRNQNPVSPSASLFRRPSTFPREESDLSWMGLFRRHRFLLLTLVVLAFLCSVYLYFAIKLGAESCSGLSAKEEALCRLKKPKVKTSHGHRATRGLLSVQDSTLEHWVQNHIQAPTIRLKRSAAAWTNRLTEDDTIEKALSVGCTGTDLTRYLNRFSVSLPGIGCKERSLLKERILELPPNLLQMESLDTSCMFDLIICENCNMLELTIDESMFRRIDRLLCHEGYFLWILEESTVTKSSYAISSFADVQSHGWACLSRINGMVLWQKV